MSVQQLSSILRSEESDEMTIRRRYCDRQPTGTRLCGYYAAAAAISVCHNVDPTGAMYDEETLVQTIDGSLTTRTADLVPVQRQEGRIDRRVEHKRKLYCLCHAEADAREMIECSACGNWFHSECVQPSRSERRGYFAGPCCRVKSTAPVPDVQQISSSQASD